MQIIEIEKPTEEFEFQLSEAELKEKEYKNPIAEKLIQKFNTQSKDQTSAPKGFKNP